MQNGDVCYLMMHIVRYRLVYEVEFNSKKGFMQFYSFEKGNPPCLNQ